MDDLEGQRYISFADYMHNSSRKYDTCTGTNDAIIVLCVLAVDRRCFTCTLKQCDMQVCKLWNDAELEVRDDLMMSKALSNSYAMAAAFAPLDAVPDMLAGRPAFRTAESIDPSAFKMIGFARCDTRMEEQEC